MKIIILKKIEPVEEKEQSPYHEYIEQYCVHCERWDNVNPEMTNGEFEELKKEIAQCAAVRSSLPEREYSIDSKDLLDGMADKLAPNISSIESYQELYCKNCPSKPDDGFACGLILTCAVVEMVLIANRKGERS